MAEKIDQEKKSLKKNLGEKEHEIQQQARTLTALEGNKKIMLKKMEELEQGLKEKTLSNKALQKEIENLNKKLDNTRKAEAKKAQELADITFVKQTEESKMIGLN